MQQNSGPINPAAHVYLPIENYGMIGDLHTVALVGTNGSIDWCCIPSFDAPSVFGAILDVEKGGFFCIAPPDISGADQKQMYLPETNILVTRFLMHQGVGEIIDFMPIQKKSFITHNHQIVRAVHVVRGEMTFQIVCRPAFNYARGTHSVEITPEGALFKSETLLLGLTSSVPLVEDDHDGVQGTFTLQAGQWVYFLLKSAQEREMLFTPYTATDYQETFLKTKHYWTDWLARCRYQGRWQEMVHRSALALKLLTYAPTGAIVAAPTTSLPEKMGGERNWDYRYTWLRDASLTVYSLLILGLAEEAAAFMHWLEARCHELAPDGTLQTMYTIHGGHDMTELTLDHLEGYRQSRPVRIGNGAYSQLQLDIYGEVMDSVYLFDHDIRHDVSYDLWTHLCRQLDWLNTHWQSADEGIWEVRGGRKHFVHSRVMSWVAYDRALRIARERGLPAPIEEWTVTSRLIYQEIMRRGWSEEKKSFVQYYGSNAVDASLLLIPLVKFAGATDPRVLQTIDCIQRELTRDPHVYRYTIGQAADDGLKGEEGTFSICSFWLVDALARAGRVEEARVALEQMLTYANHVGLYAEEIGSSGEALGNFPQAFTHLSLISACYNVDRALKRT